MYGLQLFTYPNTLNKGFVYYTEFGKLLIIKSGSYKYTTCCYASGFRIPFPDFHV